MAVRKVSRDSGPRSRLWYALAAILLVVCVLALLEATGRTHFFSEKRNVSEQDRNAKTTSTIESAQSGFNKGKERPTDLTDKNEGSVTDNKGTVNNIPTENTWSRSTDGTSIIVYTPSAGSKLTNGQLLQGASTASRIYFRLSDNIAGVIAQGSLDVVNGKYSGAFDFSTKGTEGEVEVFNQASDGRESNSVSVPVKF